MQIKEPKRLTVKREKRFFLRRTVILSSRSLTRTLFLFQEMVGSGWPLGGMHSMTAGSPAATTTSLGVWRKSSLRTGERKAGGEEEVLLKHWFLVGGWRGALTRFSTLFFNVESNGSYG